jgi:hypothetical protein
VGVPEAPKPGARWALNLTRNDYRPADPAAGKDAQVCEVVQWAQTQGSNARSGLYGLIEFVRPVKPAPAAPAPAP